MSARFNVVMSDELNREIDRAAAETESSKSEILRKAITLYLAAREAKQRGLKTGMVEPTTDKMQTEIIGI
jgi:predicted transcriptional regulator